MNTLQTVIYFRDQSCIFSIISPVFGVTWSSEIIIIFRFCVQYADFSSDSDQTSFLLEEALLWIMDSYLSQKQWFKVKNVWMMDLLSYRRSSCLLQMLTDGLECCDVFIRLSFWRHPFTAEDTLMRHWCNATFLQIWLRNKLISILDGLRVNI